MTEPSRRVEAVKDDPADNRIIECALGARADAIVSGDKHLLRIKSFERITIMSVCDFLNRLPAGSFDSALTQFKAGSVATSSSN